MKDDISGAANAECASSGWSAHLRLRFARSDATTVLASREHTGPLVVQKGLYPEGREICQVAVVHPPGVIAGGDSLALDVDLARGAHAQLVTPGAAKWYRSAGPVARQDLRFRVAAGASLEWLPHESIVFDAARALTATTLHLEHDGVAILWDVISLGRIASGERFARGSFAQRVEVVRDDALVWVEQSLVSASGALASAPAGLDGNAAFGTMLVVAPNIQSHWISIARVVGSDIASGDHAITHVPGVMIARCRGASTSVVHAWFRALWSSLRVEVLGRSAVPPRLWLT